MNLDITEYKLLDSIIEINSNGRSYDLHNDYSIKKIEFNSKLLQISFTQGDMVEESFHIIFEDAIISEIKLEFDFPVDVEKFGIDEFFRGLYEHSGKVFEKFQDRYCYYLEFYPAGSIVVLSTRCYIKFNV